MRIVHFILGRCNPDSANGVDKTAYYLSKTQTSMGHQVSLAAGDSESPHWDLSAERSQRAGLYSTSISVCAHR